MRVLIAGATGAIGIPITRALLTAGHDVVGLSRTATQARAWVTGAELLTAGLDPHGPNLPRGDRPSPPHDWSRRLDMQRPHGGGLSALRPQHEPRFDLV